MGVDLPSFRELLAKSKILSSNATVAASSVSTPTANQTEFVNGTIPKSTPNTAISASTVTGEVAGMQSKSLGVKIDYEHVASLLAIVVVMGMLFSLSLEG